MEGEARAARAAIEAQWAVWLGCPVERLREPGWSVLPGMAVPRDRVLILVREGAAVVRCHPDRLAAVRAAALADAPDPLRLDVDALAGRLGEPVAGRVPREEILYLDALDFSPAPRPLPIRALDESDDALFAALCAACGSDEVAISEVALGQPLVVGAIADGELVAASSYIDVGGPIADVGVLVHPEHRGRGLAGAVASRVCEVAFERGRIPQWWSLSANAPSLALGRRLGFRHWGFEEGIRLMARPDDAPTARSSGLGRDGSG